MSLDRAIASGAERRRPYRGSKRVDPSCRNRGLCRYCERNRRVAEARLRALLKTH